MFTTLSGKLLLGGSAFWMMIGGFVMWKMIRFDF
jgi:Flp pilus assembly protein TadB